MKSLFKVKNIFTPLVTLSIVIVLVTGRNVLAELDDHNHVQDEHMHSEEAHHAEEAGHGDQHDHGHHDEDENVTFTPEMIERSGIKTGGLTKSPVSQTRVLYGHIRLDPSRVSHVQARYPGVIKRVRVNIGDLVEKGQKLIDIEANQSLKTYTIKAPFTGLITARHANVGEQSGAQSGVRSLLTITDSSQLVAELAVFPGQMSSVRAGQTVRITSASGEVTTKIQIILPADPDAHHVTARIPIDNASGVWSTGMPIKAEVAINESSDHLLVPNSAIQTFEGEKVVFVKTADGYETRPIKTGISDAKVTQVLEGLSGLEEIVIENSYLIKAERLKSHAEHSH